jgi:hypothetical protein
MGGSYAAVARHLRANRPEMFRPFLHFFDRKPDDQGVHTSKSVRYLWALGILVVIRATSV